MPRIKLSQRIAVGIGCMAVGWGHGVAQFVGGEFESEPILQASAILPPSIVRSEYHEVDERVESDGRMHSFRITSVAGDFDVSSTAMLRIRVAEIAATVRMREIEQTETFQEALAQGGRNVFRGVANLVRHPVESLKGAAAGAQRLYDRVEESFRSQPSDAEDSTYKNFIGFSTAKRRYAAEFGVDPYSSNPALQEVLDALAWAGYTGGILPGVAAALVPSVAPGLMPANMSVALSVTGGTRMLNDLLASTPPADLRRINRDALLNMGVDTDFAEAFINNPRLSPRHQTLFVGALDEMAGVGHRGLLVQSAATAASEPDAFRHQRLAQMLAGYHLNVRPAVAVVALADAFALRDRDGVVVLAMPSDYLVWTRENAAWFDALERSFDDRGFRSGKLLWLSGGLSDLARASLAIRGWEVRANVDTAWPASEGAAGDDQS